MEAAKGRTFVLKTANKQLLREITGYAVDVLVISEKPDNLRQIVKAIKKSQQPS